MISTKNRSTQWEMMDDFSLEGKGLRNNLDVLSVINKWLGGNRISENGVLKLLSAHAKDHPVRIVDLGCGNGDMLRRISSIGRKKGYTFDLIGIDANLDTIAYARELSRGFNDIHFLQMDIFSDEFDMLDYDIVLLTLFLHHFSDSEIIEKLAKITKKTSLGVVVNDLHRHKLAYVLFNLLTLFAGSEMIRNDGLISILKGFKRKELEGYALQIKSRSQIKWKWAFRYQWILQK